MNTLSSLPPPAFGADLALRGDARPDRSAALPPTDDSSALHVSADASARSIDDIERDFLDALCQSPGA